jgi:hypothetical protein
MRSQTIHPMLHVKRYAVLSSGTAALDRNNIKQQLCNTQPLHDTHYGKVAPAVLETPRQEKYSTRFCLRLYRK